MKRLKISRGSDHGLFLPFEVARWLYREILAFDRNGLGNALPHRYRILLVQNYLERRRALVERQPGTIDLLAVFDRIEPAVQLVLAQFLRRLAIQIADPIAPSASASDRLRRVAALIEAYRAVCATLPVDLTLPPPLYLSLSAADWDHVERERACLRPASDKAALGRGGAGSASGADVTSRLQSSEPGLVQRRISAFIS